MKTHKIICDASLENKRFDDKKLRITHSSTFWIILDKIPILWISVPKTLKGMASLKLYVWQIPIVLVPTNVNIT